MIVVFCFARQSLAITVQFFVVAVIFPAVLKKDLAYALLISKIIPQPIGYYIIDSIVVQHQIVPIDLQL